MFGFLKNLVRKSGGEQQQPVAAPPAPTPVIPAAPAEPPPSEQEPEPWPEPAPAPMPPAAPVTMAPVTPVAPVVASESEGRLEIPYKSLAAKLPDSAQKFVANRSGVLQLPESLVIPQLSRGEVKISLSQLVEYSTPGSVAVPSEQRGTVIALPLSEILPRLKPEQLPKRAQKTIAVSEDIPDVFGKGTYKRATAGGGPPAPPAAASEAPAAPAAPTAPAPAAPRISPPPALAGAPKPPELAKPTLPGAPAGSTRPGVPPGVKPPSLPSAPIKTSVALPTPASKPPTTSPAAPMPSAPRPAAPIPQGPVEVPMSLMTSHFAAVGNTELANLHKATVVFPARDLDAALRKGKASFPWRLVKNWIDGADKLPAFSDETEIEFPLNVVAPIYLQSRKTVRVTKKLEVTEDIPDLFTKPAVPTGFTKMAEMAASEEAASAIPQAAPTAPPAEATIKMAEPEAPIRMAAAPPPLATSAPTPEAAPAVMPMPKAEPSVPAPKPILDYGDIFGVPSKKDWTLNEVVQKCSTLRGVGGAVITTADGLLIAGVWPDGVPTESAAAFMPQMFSRVAQYSRELNLGDPAQFTLLLENVPLQIFRTGGNYFTVLGKAGEPLPKVQLAALALRLAQNPNQK